MSASTDGEYPPIEVDDNNPTVDGDEGAYRIITGNDVDYNETDDSSNLTSTLPLDAPIRETANGEIVEIDRPLLTLEQASEIGQLTDIYRESLYTDAYIPTKSDTQPYTDVDIASEVFLAFNGTSDEPQIANEDGYYLVVPEGKSGTLQVIGAELERDENGDWQVLNPNETEVYDGGYLEYEELVREAVNETFENTGPDTSVVPTIEGAERFPTESGAVSGYWQSSQVVIDDHYAGVARITEGAIYEDYWLANPEGIDVTTISDYRITTPSDYEATRQCISGNTTGTDTRYESWEFVNAEKSLTIENGGSSYSNGPNSYVISIPDPESGQLDVHSTVTAEFEHTYGVDSTCSDNSWESTETVEVSNTYETGPRHTIKTPDASDLDITLVLDREGNNDEFYFEVVGDQRPEENPLSSLTLTATELCETDGDGCIEYDEPSQWTAHTPWIYFPQSITDGTQTRTSSSSVGDTTTLNPQESPKPIYRDYMDANKYKPDGGSTLLVTGSPNQQAQIFEGIDLGPNVGDSTGDIPLYRSYGGTLSSTGSGANQEFSGFEAHATDIFGNEIDVEVKELEYRHSEFKLDISGNSIQGQLVDAEDGSPLSGRTLELVGATRSNVTTDRNGEFEVISAEGAVRTTIEFLGDDAASDRDIYYRSSIDKVWTGDLQIDTDSNVYNYLMQIIRNLLSFVHWFALGAFMIWWTKFRTKS